jgi:DNA-binding transcriptional LysR family regulator
MDRLQAMRVFIKVVEAGGFAGAARSLQLSPPAVTRAVAALEQAIGTRLLIRTTRALKLTEAGTRYAEDCRRILGEIDEAEAAAAGSHATPSGTLIVTAPLLFGQIYVLPVLNEYLQLHPAVTGRALFLDRVVNIVEEGVDVAVRIGHLPDSEYRALPVGFVRRVVCGAPAYLDRHGTPSQPADLAAHQLIAASAAWSGVEWSFGRERKISVTVHPRLFVSNNEAAIASAAAGHGLTRVLSYQAGPALQDGRLRTVLGEYEEEPLPIHVVYAEGRRASAKVRSFVELAVERLRANRMIN